MLIKYFFIVLIKIVHGNEPFNPIVHLLIEDNINDMEDLTEQISCTGTILGGNYVITAAHCLFAVDHCKKDLKKNFNELYIPSKNIKVEYDSFCSGLNEDCDEDIKPKVVKVKKIYIHKSYIENECTEGDLAILELRHNIGNRKISVNFNKTYLPKVLLGFGFGDSPNDSQHTFTLQSDEFKVTKCLYSITPNGTFCTDESTNNFCKGDSGAPLMTRERIIYGVVSGGTSCEYIKELSNAGKKVTLNGNISYNIANFLNFICTIVQHDKENLIGGCENYRDVFNTEIKIFS